MLASVNGLAVRQIKARRLRAVLTALGIVLGVGMVFGVLLLSSTIRTSFDDLIGSAWGTKDLIVVPQGGTIPEWDLPAVGNAPGVKSASAMIGGTVVRLTAQGRPIRGAKGRINVAGYDTQGAPPYDLKYTAGRAPDYGTELAIEGNWAREHGVRVGQSLRVATATGPHRIRVVGVFTFPDGLSFGGEGTAVMPIPDARVLLAVPTGYHQLMIQAKDRGNVAPLRALLQARLGTGVRVDTPAGVSDQFKRQIDALNVVLYFFAGVALFVGGFLILNSFSMTVAQRLRELGMLRTLGSPRRMILRTVLLEAALLGLIGSAFGLLLGAGLALGLLAFMKSVGVPVADLQLSAGPAIIAVALGLVATLAGAYLPARRASRVSPIVAAQGAPTVRARPSWKRIVVGVALYVPGAVFGGTFWFGNASSGGGAKAVLGIAMTMAMFVGMALTAPVIITPLVSLLARPLRRVAPTSGRMAADATRRNPRRTAATAVALTIGLSVIVVNASMSASFIGSVHDQINQAYAADVTVRPVGATALSARTIGPQAVLAVRRLPDAGVVSAVRFVQAELPGLRGTARPYGLIEGVDPRTIAAVDHPQPEGLAADQVPAALARGEILVARGYAQQRHLGAGDTLALSGPDGSARLRIAGIYDVFNEFGGNNIRMSTAQLSRLYGPSAPSELLLRATAPDRRTALQAEVQRLIEKRHPDLEAQSTAQLKSEIDKQMSQQFALFNGIVAIAVFVSLLGIINTLAMSVTERTREIGVLRALGGSRWLVRLTMVDESLLMTTAGALAGLGLGGIIAFCWVNSIDSLLPNIAFHLPVSLILTVALLAIVLGVLAALLPARRAARLDPVKALAYE